MSEPGGQVRQFYGAGAAAGEALDLCLDGLILLPTAIYNLFIIVKVHQKMRSDWIICEED